MTFYGLTFAAATLDLTGNLYLNFTLNVVVEFIAALLAFILLQVLVVGRRPVMIGSQLLSGICVLIAGNMVNVKVNFNI